MARRRRHHRNARRVVVVNAPRRRRRRVHNPRHRARHRRHYNPRHRRRHYARRRHYRRNPPRRTTIALARPMTWVPYVIAGGAAATASAFAPRLVGGANVTANQAYLIQGGVAIAGAVALPFLGFRSWYPMAWLVGAAAPILADVVGRRVMHWLGLAWYPYSALGQEPYYPPRLYGGDVAMYPYAGGTYMFPYGEQSNLGAPEAPFEHMYNN